MPDYNRDLHISNSAEANSASTSTRESATPVRSRRPYVTPVLTISSLQRDTLKYHYENFDTVFLSVNGPS